ncbi:hypothetical protein [Mangrovibacterium sp.]|uniref:hypothetical protein n=1 Tax=Mangrovibacterium sp. TaxID=1961364 RepID=UPI0035699806
MSQQIEIKIDRSTLPSDGQKVEWQTYEDLNNQKWKQGIYHEDEECFSEHFEDIATKWDLVWDVFHWRPID